MVRPKISETFLAFREQCIWLQTCFNTYETLFEGGPETEELLARTAPLFFHDLNRILVEYCLLQVCKLTDPAETRGRENLTVDHLNELLGTAGLMTPEIEQASRGIAHYRSLIKDARNRAISHSDKSTIMAGQPIGAHAAAEVSAFFDSLHTYTDEVGVAVGVGPLDYGTLAGPGDVLDLLSLLRGHEAP